MPPKSKPRIVIIGCGFGGLEAARALHAADVDITIGSGGPPVWERRLGR